MSNIIENTVDTVDFASTPIKGHELLIGCGNSRSKQLAHPDRPDWVDLVTLDMDPSCNPDVQWNLEHLPYPFLDETFQEIHAYEVLEHFGKQGDWKGFLDQFTEFHRILKPGGQFFAAVPCWDSEWAWGDPGHTRIINAGTVSFLQQKIYEKDVGSSTMTDYRWHYKVDFELEACQETNGRLCFVLKKV
jgi:SAM-dependent methyltransferase